MTECKSCTKSKPNMMIFDPMQQSYTLSNGQLIPSDTNQQSYAMNPLYSIDESTIENNNMDDQPQDMEPVEKSCGFVDGSLVSIFVPPNKYLDVNSSGNFILSRYPTQFLVQVENDYFWLISGESEIKVEYPLQLVSLNKDFDYLTSPQMSIDSNLVLNEDLEFVVDSDDVQPLPVNFFVCKDKPIRDSQQQLIVENKDLQQKLYQCQNKKKNCVIL